MTTAFEPLEFPCKLRMGNRLMLAPMTNCQSREDGAPSAADLRWLGMRASGGFGAIMTAAAYVNRQGLGFPGQLGIDSDAIAPQLAELAATIHAGGALAIAQLHHAGLRAPTEITGLPLIAPSDDADTGARGMSNAEVYATIEDFISAAERARRAGFDGVELHGAHTYLLHEFLSSQFNRREDEFGGSAENRCRIVLEIIRGIRQRCGEDFVLGVRISPEALMITLEEALAAFRLLIACGQLDFIDLSMWDVSKFPVEEQYAGRHLLSYFTEVERGDIRLGVAGKLYGAADVEFALANGADFVLPGRSAILHHDFPRQIRDNGAFEAVALPVSEQYLRGEGLGDAFLDYIGNNWKDFIRRD